MTTVGGRLSSLSTAVVCDVQDGHGALGLGLARLNGAGVVAGRVVTACCAPGSSVAALAALESAERGDILCVSAPGDVAYVGDLFMAQARRCGLVAVIIDGYLRDSEALRNEPVSYWARGLTPAAGGRREPGQPMVPVTMGDTIVNPGDWVVADGDGAVAVPANDVDRVVAEAEARDAFEGRVRARVDAGESLFDAYVRESSA